MTKEDFAALLVVIDAVEKYRLKPEWSYGDGDMAGCARHLVKALDAAGDIDPLLALVTVGAAGDGASLAHQEVADFVRVLEYLRQMRPALERAATTKKPRGVSGPRVNLARQQLTLRLADAWRVETGRKATVTNDAIGAEERASGDFVAACLWACRGLPEEIRPNAASIDADLRALREGGRLN